MKIPQKFNLKNEKTKLIIYSLILFFLYSVFLNFTGYFEIGLLSDDYLNFVSAQNSSFLQKITSSIPYYSNLHLRPVWFLSIDLSIWLNEVLHSSKGNFVLFRIENLVYFYILIFLSGYLFFKLTHRLQFSFVLMLVILLYPNNLNDICWTVGKVDLLCGIFMLLSLSFTFSYIENNRSSKMYLAGFFFVISLFTKETSTILPLVAIMLVYISYSKEKVSEIKKLIGFEFLILILYFSYRLFVLGLQPREVVTKFQTPGIFSSLSVTFRALISLVFPYDYLSMQDYLSDRNLMFALYTVLILIFIISVLFILIRTNNIKYIFCLGIIFFISIIPNLIAGYFRPQLILIPFIFFTFALFLISTKLKIRMRFFQIISLLIIIFWGKLGYNLILDWKYSYDKSVSSINSLIDYNIDTKKRNIVIGLPSRLRQTHILDYASGAYNYWKYGDFKVTDRIIDLVLIGALDLNSLNSELGIKKVSENEYEILTSGETMYFTQLDAFRSKYKDKDIEVRLSEKNLFRKPTYLGLRILSDNVDIYVVSNDNITKLHK